MTLNELKNSKEGDKVICIKSFDLFTTGKEYTIVKTTVGRKIESDIKGIHRFLFDMIDYFKLVLK